MILEIGTTILVMWLEALESKYYGLKGNLWLLENPKAERAEMIICYTILGVSVFGLAIGTTSEVICNVAELEAPIKVW